jgi:uncharacterized protein
MVKKTSFILFLMLVSLFVLSCSESQEPVGLPLEGEIADLAEKFIEYMHDGDYSNAVSFFNSDMKKAMSERKLEENWQAVLSQQGVYEGEIEKKVEESGDYRAVNVITEFEAGPINIRVVFDKDNRVAGLWFQPVE